MGPRPYYNVAQAAERVLPLIEWLIVVTAWPYGTKGT